MKCRSGTEGRLRSPFPQKRNQGVSGKILNLTRPNGLPDIPIRAEDGQARAGREHCPSRMREQVRAGLYYGAGRRWQTRGGREPCDMGPMSIGCAGRREQARAGPLKARAGPINFLRGEGSMPTSRRQPRSPLSVGTGPQIPSELPNPLRILSIAGKAQKESLAARGCSRLFG
jgi:hypothetical protein